MSAGVPVTRWDYLVIPMPVGHIEPSGDGLVGEYVGDNNFAALGSDGWEHTAVIETCGRLVFYFKRPRS